MAIASTSRSSHFGPSDPTQEKPLVRPSNRSEPTPAPAHAGNTHDDEEDEEEDADDDDDPVVMSFPIFYTSHYVNSLALLQYLDRTPRLNTQHPLLPPSLRPLSAADIQRAQISARHKPSSGHLELEVPFEMNEERWNEETAEKMGEGLVLEEGNAQGEKGKGKGRHQVKEHQEGGEKRRLSKMLFKSLVVPEVALYTVGVLKDNRLHLSPVTQTYQLRPALTYLDHAVTLERRAKREAAKDQDDSDPEVSDTELKKQEAKAVQVSVKQSADLSGGGAFGKSGASGGGNGRAGASLFDPLRATDNESWIPLTHYNVETGEANEYFDRMLVENDDVKLHSKGKPRGMLMKY